MNRDDDSDLERAWQEGAPADDITISPRLSVVLSIRLPAHLLDDLGRRAEAEGRTESQVARDLIEVGLASDLPTTPPELARAFARWVEEVQRMDARRSLEPPANGSPRRARGSASAEALPPKR